MQPTTGYSFGDVVLVPFPFTDQAGTKKRPAVIISGAAYNTAQRDLVIMAVTSQLHSSGALGEAPVTDWHAAGLIKPSAIKPVITTIEQTLVIRRLGQLSTEDQQELRNTIARIVG
jgi:mRNA interferase MazF